MYRIYCVLRCISDCFLLIMIICCNIISLWEPHLFLLLTERGDAECILRVGNCGFPVWYSLNFNGDSCYCCKHSYYSCGLYTSKKQKKSWLFAAISSVTIRINFTNSCRKCKVSTKKGPCRVKRGPFDLSSNYYNSVNV